MTTINIQTRAIPTTTVTMENIPVGYFMGTIKGNVHKTLFVKPYFSVHCPPQIIMVAEPNRIWTAPNLDIHDYQPVTKLDIIVRSLT